MLNPLRKTECRAVRVRGNRKAHGRFLSRLAELTRLGTFFALLPLSSGKGHPHMSELYRCLSQLDSEIALIESLLSRHPCGQSVAVPLPKRIFGRRGCDLATEVVDGQLRVVVRRRAWCYPGFAPRGRRLDRFDSATRSEIAKHLPRLLAALTCDKEAEQITRTVSKLRTARQRQEHIGLLRRYFGGTAVVEATKERLIEA